MPILWKQDLLSGDPLSPPESTRFLSLHGKAGWPNYWFQDKSLYDILFEIDIRPDSESKWNKQRLPEIEGTIGVLRYCQMQQDLQAEETMDSFIGGCLSLNDRVFDDLWERVRLKVVFPCAIWIDVLGMTSDTSPFGDDHWDVKGQPKLPVVGVKFRFTAEHLTPSHEK